MSETVLMIDRHASTPYYQQLSELLEKRIERGDIATGSRLPSEHDLCDEFGLSRATVRQALQALENKGAVERVPARGVFARKREVSHGWFIQGGEGFLENAVGHQNRAVSTQVLRSGPKRLPGFAARAFAVEIGSVGHELVRLRSLDGTPALYSVNYSPPALVPVITEAADVLNGTASFSGLLANAGYGLGAANRTIIAVSPTAEIAERLGIRRSIPLLQIRSLSWTRTGVCFDVYDTWVRSDVVPLEITVNALAANPRGVSSPEGARPPRIR